MVLDLFLTKAFSIFLSGGRRRISHRPNRIRVLIRLINIASPRIATDMQMSIISPIKHDPSASIAYRVRRRDAVALGVVHRIARWDDHVMRTDRNSRALVVEGIRGAVLSSAAQHVYQTRGFVGRGRLLGHSALHPLNSHCVRAHWHVADHVLVAGETGPAVGALAERDNL